VPKLVLAGHVHSYQRYTTTFLGQPCTFVVVGNGGHAMDRLPRHGNPPVNVDHTYPVRLEFATDSRDHAGFLRITATRTHLECALMVVGQSNPLDGPFRL